MPMQITIRCATTDDAEAISTLSKDL